MSAMTLVLENPEAIAEVEELMARFGLSVDAVVERVILEAGTWMPMELLDYPPAKRTFPPAEANYGDSERSSE